MITASVQTNLGDLNTALLGYERHSKKAPEQILRQKGTQIILGNSNPKYGATFKGLYDRLEERAPKEGTISQDRQRALDSANRGSRRPVKVRPRALARADELLEGQPSGVFDIIDFGRGGARKRVVPIRVFTKGKRQGVRSTSRRRAKSAQLLSGTSFLARERGTILNRKNLSILIELNQREAGRHYTAAAFLPKRFRRMRDENGTVKRSLAKNKTGATLGSATLHVKVDGASLHIEGFTPALAKPWAQQALSGVLAAVAKDTAAYSERKEAEALQRELTTHLRKAR
ncbi:hypothetical protein [Cerasicoccus arenae]|uniref:Uncharacterized protein n=1 Tax=Cerasicoccus arenae TaxID=424488 RepID=A0A8J3DFW8_9BACT|nr:hypothetical protein [Cerasicoccus arenae]MBK1858235.1 hypothetical protein [Cerasicoccus arenae]GHC02068.1 hypothetical protein GCM10007047_18220 [Cerasicoccus arenae]